jgi:hypothetical protein
LLIAYGTEIFDQYIIIDLLLDEAEETASKIFDFSAEQADDIPEAIINIGIEEKNYDDMKYFFILIISFK